MDIREKKYSPETSCDSTDDNALIPLLVILTRSNNRPFQLIANLLMVQIAGDAGKLSDYEGNLGRRVGMV